MDNFGINYESGKIIDHIINSCIAFANIQIAMDAPFKGRIADESLRSKGRSEQQFHSQYGYDEEKLKRQLYSIFEYIKKNYPSDIKLVLQIARGRAAKSTFIEILHPILIDLNIIDRFLDFFDTKQGIIKYKSGYRTSDYFTPTQDYKFIFINYGMFAVLTNEQTISVGTICNVSKTIYIGIDNKQLTINKITTQDNDKNILSKLDCFPQLYLCGIDDNMPFITPDEYSEKEINELLLI